MRSGYAKQHMAALEDTGLNVWCISCHLVGQAVADRIIDGRHKAIVPAHVWGDGEAEGVRQRAADEVIKTAEAAAKLGLDVVSGFTGSPIWHLFYSWPPNLPEDIEAGFQETRRALDAHPRPLPRSWASKFALEVHPSEIAFDGPSWSRALDAIGRPPRVRHQLRPQPLRLPERRLRPVHPRPRRPDLPRPHEGRLVVRRADGGRAPSAATPSSATRAGAWDFRSLGRGRINFEDIIRALNDVGYDGPLSVEWEDMKMDREHGAAEAAAFVKSVDFPASDIIFDQQFSKASEG